MRGWWAAPLVLLSCGVASAAPHAIGFNVHQNAGAGLNAASACGGSIVRIDFNWFQAEPSKGAYDWAPFDDLIDEANAKGLTVLAVLAYTPAWASSGDVDGKKHDNDVPKAGEYEAFVSAAVGRYKDRVQHWELWNEPNLGEFFEGTPQQYVDLILKPGAAAVRAACPSCKTVGPGIATLVAGKYDVWMQTVLEQAKDSIDIVSGHVYADFPKYEGDLGATFYTKLEAHRTTGVLVEDPLSLRESQVKWGAGKKPFWLTETGKAARYGNASAMDAQAVYTRKVLEAMLSRSWWQATIFYEAFDEPGTTYDFGFTLRDPMAKDGFDPKPACGLAAKAAAQQPLFGGKGADCDDGLDNDLDGKIDYPTDDDCSAASTVSEGSGPPPADDAGMTDDAETGAAAAPEPASSSCAMSRSRSGPVGALALALALVRVLRPSSGGTSSRRRGSRSPSS